MIWLYIYLSDPVVLFVVWLVSSIVEVESYVKIIYLLHCIIISSPYVLKNDWKFFLIRSDSGPLIILNTTRPLSLHNPTSFLLYFSLILFNIKIPANSQTSAPSYTPMVTSKMFSSLFIYGFSLLNKSGFLAWYICCMSYLVVFLI